MANEQAVAVCHTREITRDEATEMARLACNLVTANHRRSPTSEHATLAENDAMFELKWRLNKLFEGLKTYA